MGIIQTMPSLTSDHSGWLTLWEAYRRFYRVKLADGVTERLWTTLHDPDAPSRGLVAEDERGALVGLTHFQMHPSTWSLGPYCYLEHLFVDPNARGQGYARAG